MRAKQIGNHIIMRIDRGEMLLDELNSVCRKYSVGCASVSGIGATDSFVCGVFNLETKEYKEFEFNGTYEILSLSGNITVKDGDPYIHLHICAGDELGKCIGGHLKQARISATCEIIISLIDCKVGRVHDAGSGLNLLDI